MSGSTQSSAKWNADFDLLFDWSCCVVIARDGSEMDDNDDDGTRVSRGNASPVPPRRSDIAMAESR